jgi:hypothetical protein
MFFYSCVNIDNVDIPHPKFVANDIYRIWITEEYVRISQKWNVIETSNSFYIY